MTLRTLTLLCLLSLPARAEESLIVYSGRNETLISPLLSRFEKEKGVKVNVRYGDTAQLAALLVEEGKKSPADVFIAQDAGALGLLEKEKLFAPLSPAILERVAEPGFRSAEARWVGLSGRARVIAYNKTKLKAEELPSSVDELTDPRWKGRIGWAPTNGSFQAFVTALRLDKGEKGAREWLAKLKANAPRAYPNNTAIVEALSRGEVAVGLVNHYYLHAVSKRRKKALPVANHYLPASDPGGLVNVAGAGVLASSGNQEAARALVAFLLSDAAQAHLSSETFEYPVVKGVAPPMGVPPLAGGESGVDLSKLEDLRQTLALLRDVGVL